MSGIVTTASVMMCPHGGTVQASPSSTSVQAGGSPVLTASDVFVIAGCAFVIGAVPSPCVSVQWVQPALQSSRSGNPTLTQASVGLCLAATQAPQGPVMIVNTQPNVTGL
jgi:hypothetical protein